ncbi:hypothetical protein FACS1894130_02350 [Spirochaetia bacterium]|nr:hypothetical protein FACS1894130_02350 [Spirochaetia bacterium]
MFAQNISFIFFKNSCIAIIVLLLLFTGCASTQAYKDLNELEENAARGDPDNPIIVKEYLQSVLSSPDGRQVKAYERRAYSTETKKNIFVVHSYYVFFKNAEMEHTLVFTATPKNSELNGSWMLDAKTDIDSYNLFLDPHSGNPWEVLEYRGPNGELNLNFLQTTQSILNRLDKGYTFFGPANVRNLSWYHHVWMALVPPPILVWAPMLIFGVHTDSCTSAVVETLVWEQ